ncbi:hypothetical protein NW765_015526 [Fusarium oxysporum]|nr:hypothetical protein NW765_015526 [Fusarium oxysporum]
MHILVHDDRHAGDKHEHGRHRCSAIIALAQHHDPFFLRRLTVFPLMLGNEDVERGMSLPLERECCLYIQVPSVPVEWRHHCDTRLPWNASLLVIAVAVQKLDIRLILGSLLNTR